MLKSTVMRLVLVMALVFGVGVPRQARGANAVVSGACLESDFDAAWATADTGTGGTITFNCGSVNEIIFTTTKGLASGRAITIDGADAITLTGYATFFPLVQTRLFSTTNSGSALTLKNLILRQGTTPGNGGAILVGANSAVIVEKSAVRDSGANTGGAIANLGGTLIVRNSIFDNNVANVLGGAINATDVVSISGSTFSNNLTLSGGGNCNGGALALATSRAEVVDSLFTRNVAAGGRGGAICLDSPGSLTLTHVSLISNTAAEGGGGLYARSGTVLIRQSSVISGNSALGALGSGGGILALDDAALTIADSTLTSNRSGALGGGALFLSSTRPFVIQGALIDRNAASGGGGLEIEGPMTMTNSTVSGNVAVHGGGIRALHALSIQGSAISENIATDWDGSCAGGGIVSFTALDARDTQILSNTARGKLTHAKGGGICVSAGIARLDGVTLGANRAFTSFDESGTGGAVYAETTTSLQLTNSTVQNNVASSGAGLYSLGRIDIARSAVLSNSALVLGGGIYMAYGAGVFVTETIVRANSASISSGGGIYVGTSTASIERSLISQNSAAYGGAFAQIDSYVAVTNTTISGNSATIYGGGILAGAQGAPSRLSLTNATLALNSAPDGGSLFRYGNGPITTTVGLVNTVFDQGLLGANCSGGVTSVSYSYASDNSCFSAGGTNGVGNPKLGALAANQGVLAGALGQALVLASHLPLAASPLIDNGQNLLGFGVSLDQRGFVRPQGPAFDIGAVEIVVLEARAFAPLVQR